MELALMARPDDYQVAFMFNIVDTLLSIGDTSCVDSVLTSPRTASMPDGMRNVFLAAKQWVVDGKDYKEFRITPAMIDDVYGCDCVAFNLITTGRQVDALPFIYYVRDKHSDGYMAYEAAVIANVIEHDNGLHPNCETINRAEAEVLDEDGNVRPEGHHVSDEEMRRRYNFQDGL